MRQNPTNSTTTSSNSNEGEKADGFFKLEMREVPDFAYWKPPKDDQECEQEYLRNCSYLTYSYDSVVGCMIWGRTLVDIQKFSVSVVDLQIRVAHSELDPTKRALLDWRKRIQIIEGISRGIIYLHRDSRLRVIHRDLKASTFCWMQS